MRWPSGLTSTSIQVPSSVLNAICLVLPCAADTSHFGASSFFLSAAQPAVVVRARAIAAVSARVNRMIPLLKTENRRVRRDQGPAPYLLVPAPATCRKLGA
jgi:hypothetical protein